MAALLTARTTDTVTTGVATTASPAWLEIEGDSVFAGAQIAVVAASVNTPAKFTGLSSKLGTIQSAGWLRLDVPVGTFISLVQSRSATGTSINANLL